MARPLAREDTQHLLGGADAHRPHGARRHGGDVGGHQ